jgi:hypothetical protein
MNVKELEKLIEIEKKKEICSICKGQGYWMDAKGTVQTCWKCLNEGKLSK